MAVEWHQPLPDIYIYTQPPLGSAVLLAHSSPTLAAKLSVNIVKYAPTSWILEILERKVNINITVLINRNERTNTSFVDLNLSVLLLNRFTCVKQFVGLFV